MVEIWALESPFPPATGLESSNVQMYGYMSGALQRAEKAGYGILVVTVDAPRLGRREADMKNGCAQAPCPD